MITNAKYTSENEQLLQAITIRQKELKQISTRLIELESTELKSKQFTPKHNNHWFEENSNALLPVLLPKAI